jgi:hypothetical protein
VIFPGGSAELFSPYFSPRERRRHRPITIFSSAMGVRFFRPAKKILVGGCEIRQDGKSGPQRPVSRTAFIPAANDRLPNVLHRAN